ncbi:MAG: LmeA family phospholipid-binding protein, partial [Mycobacterium sp.]
MRMRKVLVGAAAVLLTIVIVLVGAAGVDFGISIYAEYRLARSMRESARLGFDPFVAIIAFPLIPQAMRHRYEDLEIKATAVDRPLIGKATLEATMHSIDLTDTSWLIRPDAKLRVGKLES